MDIKGITQIDKDRILYRNNGTTCYMIIRGGEEPRLPYQVNTIRYNKIGGLIPVSFLIEDGEYRYFYDITGKESLFEQMKNRKYTLMEIRTILSDLYRCIRLMEEYLLDINLLLLEPEYIFWDKRKNEYGFCFYPEKKESFETSFKEILEHFMNFLDYQDENTVVLVYSMYQKARSQHTSFAEIMQGFCEIDEQSEKREEEVIGQDSFRVECAAEKAESGDGDWSCRERSDFLSDRKYGKLQVLIPYIPDAMGGYAAAMILKYLKEQYAILSAGQRALCIAAAIGIAGICLFISFYLSSVMKQRQEYRRTEDEEADREFFRLEEKLKKRRQPESVEKKNNTSERFRKTDDVPDRYGEEDSRSGQDTEAKSGSCSSIFEEYAFHGENEADESDMPVNGQIPYGRNTGKPVRERIPATVVMRPSGGLCSGNPVLVSCNRAKSHDIVIDKEEILIGKIQGVADCCLHAKNVSRIHAKVFRNQENYEIMDMGSTNGTYVNGARIAERKRVCLMNDDEVQLADIDFIFKTGGWYSE